MLDQETARALLTAADEGGARVVLVGDRRQLPAVGIGGVVDLAAKWAPARVELTDVHRFRRRNQQPDGSTAVERDDEFADLSLRIRSGIDPGAVFDALVQRGEIRLHDSEAAAMGELAWQVARRHIAGTDQAVSVATNESASMINDAVREQLVTAGLVDDQQIVHGNDGLRMGVGDRVMTRSNDPQAGVANRQVWTLAAVNDEGTIRLIGDSPTPGAAGAPEATVGADYVREHVHLAYASTVHGVQGETVDVGDVLASDSSDAPSVYVGLTRGRYFRTLHMVGDHDTARDTYIDIAGRNRADLGLEQARRAATVEAEQYAPNKSPRRSAALERMAALREQLTEQNANRRAPQRADRTVPDTSDPLTPRAPRPQRGPDGPRQR